MISRSQFLRVIGIGAVGAFVNRHFAATAVRAAQAEASTERQRKKRDRGPRISLDRVEEFVGVAHSNIDRVRELLREEPALVNATWDWGGGDFETALGAAAHTGQRDIATLLLNNNARLDIFAAAMLGKTDIVRAAAAAFPDLPSVPGPHGIPLILHAKKGGDAAQDVVRFLESLG